MMEVLPVLVSPKRMILKVRLPMVELVMDMGWDFLFSLNFQLYIVLIHISYVIYFTFFT
jgi:hypothetical protein